VAEVLASALDPAFAQVPFERNEPGREGDVACYESWDPAEDDCRYVVHALETPFQEARSSSPRVKKKTTRRVPEPQVVWATSWDWGMIAFNGCDTVYRVRGVYFHCSENMGKTFGPYRSLREVLAHHEHLAVVTDATEYVNSPLYPASRVASMLSADVEDDHPLSINGESWIYRSGEGFRRTRRKGRNPRTARGADSC
jgi:hypothetical protein